MINNDKWTRICTEDDFYDVIEDFDDVMSKIEGEKGFVEFTAKAGYRLCIRVNDVLAIYEHGVDIMKRVWEFSKQLDDLKKDVVGWSGD